VECRLEGCWQLALVGVGRVVFGLPASSVLRSVRNAGVTDGASTNHRRGFFVGFFFVEEVSDIAGLGMVDSMSSVSVIVHGSGIHVHQPFFPNLVFDVTVVAVSGFDFGLFQFLRHDELRFFRCNGHRGQFIVPLDGVQQ